MTTLENGTETTTTVREFFDTLDIGAVVTPNDGGAQYIYAGYFTPPGIDTRPSITIVSVRYAEITFLTEIDGPSTNQWIEHQIEQDGEMVTRTVDLETRRLVTSLVNNHNWAQNQQREFNSLQDENRSLRMDFVTVNDRINDYADDQGMCGDYERRIFGWNDELRVSKLYGRLRNYDVEVKIADFPYSNYVSVESRSPEQAREAVQDMGIRELLYKLVNADQSFDDVAYEIVGDPQEGDE